MSEFAQCIFRRTPDVVAMAVMWEPGTHNDELAAIASPQCLKGTTIRFAPNLFRGALMAEMFRQHQAHLSDKWRYPIEPLALSTPLPANANDAERTDRFMLELADCLHAKDPADVTAIVSEPVASEAEKIAFSRVIPMLGPCVPTGTTATLSKASIQAAFGEYMYRSLADTASSNPSKAG